MLALQKTAPRVGLHLRETAVPVLRAGEVLIEVEATGICGSDLHIDRWEPAYSFMQAAIPVTLGHEFSGRVVCAADDVSGWSGERVIVMPSVTCGICEGCITRGPDYCSNRRGIGITRDGAFARFVTAPAVNCVRIPAALGFEVAALTEPMTVSGQAVATGNVTLGSRVLVMGPGTIGQGIAVLARAAGAAEVIVSGRDDPQRFSVLRAMGFEALVDVAEAGAERRLRELAGRGFDAVFDAAGVPEAIHTGLACLRAGGSLVMSGIYNSELHLDGTQLVRKSQQLKGSYRAPRAMWPMMADLLARHQDQFAPMITHRLPLGAALEGFSLAHARRASKVMILPLMDPVPA